MDLYFSNEFTIKMIWAWGEDAVHNKTLKKFKCY